MNRWKEWYTGGEGGELQDKQIEGQKWLFQKRLKMVEHTFDSFFIPSDEIAHNGWL